MTPVHAEGAILYPTMNTEQQTSVQGEVAAGFERVAEAFGEVLAAHPGQGQALAVYRGAERLVDVWGGTTDIAQARPWEADTAVLVFSASKAVAGLTLAWCHARGLIDYDAPVAKYWPDFETNGKAAVTVRQLLSHQAGLCALDQKLSPEIVGDKDALAAILGRQKPRWEPGTRHGYHAFTLGSFVSELCRCIDPKARGLQALFAEEIAGPLGIDFSFGLGSGTIPAERVAEIHEFGVRDLLAMAGTLRLSMLLKLGFPWTLVSKTLMNPKMKGPNGYDKEPWRQLEFASATGYGSANALAQLFGDAATGGEALGFDALTCEAIEAEARPPSGGSLDLIWKRDTAYALGFGKACPMLPLPHSPRAYGLNGASGANVFADPEHGIGFAYVCNKIGKDPFNDLRERPLFDATYACLESGAS